MKMDESEALTLIKNYGTRISQAGGGLGGTTRSDIVEWAARITELTKLIPRKNSRYLCQDPS